MDICVYVNIKKVLRCECVNTIIGVRGGFNVWGGASEVRQTWGVHGGGGGVHVLKG